MSKKIAVISSHTHSLFWFRMNMMEEFTRHGYEVIALGQEAESVWKQQFAAHGIRYQQIYVERNGMNPLKDLRTLRELDLFFKHERPEKVFCYQAKTIIYTCLAARKNGIKEVYPLVAGLGSIFRGDSLKRKLIKAVMVTEYKLALRCSKRVMFQNNDDLSAFVDGQFLKSEICVSVNGSGVVVHMCFLLRMPEKPAFLMISRLIKDKGVMEYLDACKMIKTKHPDATCLLVGPYDTNPSALKEDELQKYIDDGTITYFGEQLDVRPYIGKSSVFILPSYHEGTPKSVLECMSCGRAIITTDAPGCRETVTDGVNGYLVPVKDAKAVAEKMEVFLRQPELAAQMGAQGRSLVEQKYDVRKVNASIMKIMSI